MREMFEDVLIIFFLFCLLFTSPIKILSTLDDRMADLEM